MNTHHLYEFDYLIRTGLFLQYADLEEGFQKKEFSISDVGVSTRLMNSWEKNGLLPKNTGGLHRRFNLEEYVWLKIIQKLKKFDVKLPIIRELGKQLMEVQDLNQMIQSPDIKSQLSKILGEASKKVEPKVAKAISSALDDILKMDVIKSALSQARYTFLGLLIRDAILLKNHLSIMVNEKGEATPFKEAMADQFYSHSEFLEFLRSTYVSVSLTQILKEFIEDHTAICHYKLALITYEEFNLLEAIRGKKIKSVSIYFDENDKMNRAEIIEIIPSNKIGDVVNAILTCDYGSIKVVKENKKIQHIENTRKVKL